MKDWYQRDAAEAVAELGSDPGRGLTREASAERLRRFGPNDIGAEESRGILRMLLAQFKNFMIVVLIVAAVVSGVVGELGDTIAILVIVVLNAGVGAIQ